MAPGLGRFRRSKLVVLRPTSTAYEAARAMTDNHIGAVLAGTRGRLVGVVTDRDPAGSLASTRVDGRLHPGTRGRAAKARPASSRPRRQEP